jgi:hypothetical protein
MRSRREITFDNDTHSTESDNRELAWSTENSYLDLMICVGRGLGLGTVIPNLQTHHNWELKLDLTRGYKQFTATQVPLGFNPEACMMWIGCSPGSEDVWLAFVPANFEDDSVEDEGTGRKKKKKKKKKKISTTLSSAQQKRVVVFLAKMLSDLGYRDIHVSDDYPNVEDKDEYEDATNIL